MKFQFKNFKQKKDNVFNSFLKFLKNGQKLIFLSFERTICSFHDFKAGFLSKYKTVIPEEVLEEFRIEQTFNY